MMGSRLETNNVAGYVAVHHLDNIESTMVLCKRTKRNVIYVGFSVAAFGLIFFMHFRRLAATKSSNSTPALCTDGVLDKKNYDYSHHPNQGLWLLRPRHHCKLKFYSQADFVSCLDSLFVLGGDRERLHFSFVGDSRVRQYYYNFLKFVPGYDHPWQDPSDHTGKHVSRNISSPLLHGMIVSFYWQPAMDDEVHGLLSNWADDSDTATPHFLLIGISVHHMVMNLGNDHLKLGEGIVKMIPILERLKRRRPGIRIVWLNQPPTIDSVTHKKGVYVRPVAVQSDKIHQYNQVTREILKNASSTIKIWDSSNHVVEEYVRSCEVVQRSAPQWIDTWMDCTDYIHPGYSAMTQTTQILLNEMCNSALISNTFA